ncbi:MAG: hypothetical protein IAI50_05115 [Candidatus Eremiobacteraeota bacterium]|nr:hypothetical protein [Candidatus Eremiobacteraeota bacterium]
MSVINNNGLVPVFAPAGGLGAPAPANAQGSAPGFPPSVRTDNIEAMPYQASAQDSYGPEPGDGYDQNTGGFGGVYNQLLGSISNLFSNLGSMFGYASNSGTSATGQAPTRSGGQGQKFFTTASASSVGDPHESFNGTTAAGTSIDQKWNSMISHPNLLDSNSFDGGYRV